MYVASVHAPLGKTSHMAKPKSLGQGNIFHLEGKMLKVGRK